MGLPNSHTMNYSNHNNNNNPNNINQNNQNGNNHTTTTTINDIRHLSSNIHTSLKHQLNGLRKYYYYHEVGGSGGGRRELLMSEKSHSNKIKRKQIILICLMILFGFYIFTPFYTNNTKNNDNGTYYFTTNLSLSSIFKNKLPSLPNILWESSSELKNYLVHTDTCKLLDMDPFDKSVSKFFINVKSRKCSQGLVIEENQVLKIDNSIRKSWKYSGSSCCYRKVNRLTQSDAHYNRNADWGISYSKNCYTIPSNGQILINDSYIKVECTNTHGIKTFEDFYGIVLPPEQLSSKLTEKLSKWDDERSSNIGSSKKQSLNNQKIDSNNEKIIKADNNDNRPPNIIIIGIDSISRLHMIRSLPKTKSFLLENDYIELKGYTKIGENTFPNVMGILAGMSLNNYSSCWTSPSKKVDDCPFIWKDFSQNGYLTALVEDSPGLAIFNYAKVGFLVPPVDYYLRPIMTAQHSHYRIDRNSGHSHCVGGGLTPTKFLMKYIQNILRLSKARNYPNFIFSWFTSIGHDDMNLLKTEDDNFKNFLSELTNGVNYDGNNSVIFFVSDHGYRFGSFRETFLGFYEESLPFFFVKLPPRLKSQFPNWYSNLKLNSNRLTSPLDFHETLKDLLALSLPPPSSSLSSSNLGSQNKTGGDGDVVEDTTSASVIKSYSFFKSTPLNRTCENTGIPNQYCMCGVMPELATSSEKLQQLAKIILNNLNHNVLVEMISKHSCVPFKFTKVLYGRLLSIGDVWNNFGKLISFSMYLVAFEVSPGHARFEAKIKQYENGTEIIQGDVNRISSYAGQSDCMTNGFLKKYCYCQNIKSKS